MWLRLSAALAIAYLIVSNGLLFFAGVPQIAVFLGVSAALLSNHTNGAIVMAAGVGAVMTILSPPRLVFDQGGASVLLQMSLLSAGVAYGVRAMRDRWPSRDAMIVRGCAAVLITLLLVNFWVPLLVAGIHPLVGYGPLPAAALRPVPEAGVYITDDELYRRFFHLLHQGQGHYEAFRDAWLGLRFRGELPASVTAYRLPTYYWIWRALPADAFLVVPVFLVFVSAGGVAAAAIASTLRGAAWAPLAAAAVLTYGMGVAISVYVTYIDLPAACIALCGIAVALEAYRRRSLRWIWAAVGLLTVAALTREILAYLLGVGAVSTFAMRPLASSMGNDAREVALARATRWRFLQAWVAGLLVFGLGYAMHAWQVMTHIAGRTGHLDYQRGGVAFALTAISVFGDVFSGTNLLLALLVLMGVVGIWRATRASERGGSANTANTGSSGTHAGMHAGAQAGTHAGAQVGTQAGAMVAAILGTSTGSSAATCRVFLLLAVLAPLAMMLVVGNPSRDLHGGLVNYWGQLFVPIALSCWPLAFASDNPRGKHDV